jgi:RecA-family ATPase
MSGYSVRSGANFKNTKVSLPYIDIAADLKPRRWFIPDRIPGRNVTLLSGEGAIGKSTLLMQLLGATVVIGGQWLGTFPEHGPALYLTAEEEDNEARLRLEAVAESLGTNRYQLKGNGLNVLSFAGRDAVLAAPDKSGFLKPTPLFERIREDVLQLKPKLIGIDAAADVFAGNEINRAQTRQFITLLRGLAIDIDGAVVLVAHPSLQGITSDTGLSGNTAWHNSVRARMYFKKAPGDDKSLRVLEVKKNNYGPEQENILLRWKDGVYQIVKESSIEQLTEDARVDDLFLNLLRRFAEQGRNVSHNAGRSYAPSRFAETPEAQATKTSSKHFAAAMERLFTAKRIRAKDEGRPSHKIWRLVEILSGNGGGQRPANGQPTPANDQEGGRGGPSPLYPLGVGPGQGPTANGQPREEPLAAGTGTNTGASATEDSGTVASVPFMITRAMREQLHQCGVSDDQIADLTPQQAHDIIRGGLSPSDNRAERDH